MLGFAHGAMCAAVHNNTTTEQQKHISCLLNHARFSQSIATGIYKSLGCDTGKNVAINTKHTVSCSDYSPTARALQMCSSSPNTHSYPVSPVVILLLLSKEQLFSPFPG